MERSDRHIAMLFNPSAGSGRGLLFMPNLREFLERRQVLFTVFTSKWPSDLTAFSDAWIVGGDGTLHVFINRYPECNIPIALFPGGSGNDFFWLIYGERSLQEQIEIAYQGKVARMDAGMCNGKLFMNGIGIGFDGSIARALMQKDKRPGIASYWLAVIRQLFFYREKSYSIRCATFSVEGEHLLIDCMNGRRSGGGFLVTPQATPDDGYLDVMACRSLKWWKRLWYLPVIQKGRHTNLPFVTCLRTKELIISGSKSMEAHMDGEYIESKEMTINVLPGRFLFRIP
jgi:YegS/Rv2252/BmrU family lipid kinase